MQAGKTATLMALLISFGAGAQVQTNPVKEQTSLEIDSSIFLESAVVVGRRNEVAADLPYQIEVIGREEQLRVQSLTTADALSTLSGVYVQKSQLGGGSPIVRGFEANRVLLVVDGVRMNNAIYRSGHLQNAITVDPNMLEQIEVVYGAGALAYGSDAIGGVVHFRTRRPDYRPDDSSSGYLQSNFGSAARSVNLAGDVEYGGANWAGMTALSFTRFGNLRAGGNRPDSYGDFGLRDEYVVGDEVVTNDNPQRQIGSGYEQYNLLQKLRFRLGERVELSANLQYSTTGDIPRYDALIERRNGELRWARWDYGPQTRTLGSLRLDDRRATALYDIATYLVSHQFMEEDRLQRRLGSPVLEESLIDVTSINAQVDYAKALSTATDLRYGFDLRYDDVIAESSPADEPTRYPSQGSSLAAGGIYVDLSRELSDRWQLRGGLRYGYQSLKATFGTDDPVEWPRAYTDGIVNPSSALTGALGLHYRRGANGLRLLFAQGFRAPNVDDFAKFREQNGRIQVPNPDLDPERSNTLEASYTRAGERLRLEITGYGTLLTDAIIRRNGALPDGSTSFVSRGDTLFVDTNVNAERAWIYGFDVAAAYAISSEWELRSEVHSLRGLRRQDTPDGGQLTLPQDHIPSVYGRASVRYASGRWDGSVRVDFQLRKPLDTYAVNSIEGTASTGYTFDRVGTSDNIDLTPNEEGTPGWWTLNVYAGYRVSERLSIQFKAENVLDRFYQPFASGIAAPGIDLGLGVRWGW